MKKASIWFLLLILISFQQPHVLEFQNGHMDGDVLKADDSHLTSIEIMLSPLSSLPHHVDSVVPRKIFLSAKLKSYAPPHVTEYVAMDIFPDAIGFKKIIMSQSNYLS
ncbi:hypothetical protein N5C46_09875 [Rossellomorea vietnamensis]|uniref:Uncharacterized protein n=1 Tax=Rossellomorea vietnamensis TaxID=218284 RepID=A0ACD4CDK4_9BACI|nr:hypothetical protein [Rossellomorea vietnamensis]UXH46324.1 hypothetical protein N5C46_09875 [Rossellomorea vietnamensis]